VAPSLFSILCYHNGDVSNNVIYPAHKWLGMAVTVVPSFQYGQITATVCVEFWWRSPFYPQVFFMSVFLTFAVSPRKSHNPPHLKNVIFYKSQLSRSTFQYCNTVCSMVGKRLFFPYQQSIKIYFPRQLPNLSLLAASKARPGICCTSKTDEQSYKSLL